MKQKKCPYCRVSLHLDYWDTVEEQADGSFLFDAFEAWVCEKRCGYYQRGKEIKHNAIN